MVKGCMRTTLPSVAAPVDEASGGCSYTNAVPPRGVNSRRHATVKPNSRAALAVVTWATSSTDTPLSSATFFAVSTT